MYALELANRPFSRIPAPGWTQNHKRKRLFGLMEEPYSFGRAVGQYHQVSIALECRLSNQALAIV